MQRRAISAVLEWLNFASKCVLWIGAGILALVVTPLLARALNLGTEDLLLLIRLLLSWPAVALALSLVAIAKFKGPISALIVRGGWKLPGVDVQLSPEIRGVGATEKPSPSLEEIVDQSQRAGDQRGVPKERLDYEIRKGILWEFAFMNLHFIAPTKYGLSQIQATGGLTPDALGQVVLHQFPQMGRPETILPALKEEGVVIAGDDGLVRISRKGLAFLEFLSRGAPLPPSYPSGDVVYWPAVEAARAEAIRAAQAGKLEAPTPVPTEDASPEGADKG